ncbi:MAG: 3'-5' exonuclease [Planctomycetaceae bacterium]|jgi:predicted PolB exonuclease-like 3'-5' exonuclease|nr:3'-5' exonuclease [Planctomycetaceae bacterium]
MSERPSYLVFDIESVADAALISKVHFNGEVPAEKAVARYRTELLDKSNGESDFIPYTFQYPICVTVAKVAGDFSLQDVVVLDEPQFRPHEICNKFWKGWLAYQKPTLVSFNGRGFDIPMMELASFRYGISIPEWFAMNAKTFDQPRNRYNTTAHTDLYDILTNFGATRFTGGLNLSANILGKPGKIETKGYMVQDMYDEGRLAEINDYCRCDVLDTYFVFLRTMVLTGALSLRDEQVIVKKTKDWLTAQLEQRPVYKTYLDNWGDWTNPWEN